MNEERIKKLASDLLFEPNEEVVLLTKQLLANIDHELEELDQLDLTGIKPMTHINERAIDFALLREDEPDLQYVIKKDDLLNNASDHDQDFVIMKKVI
ncbi:Asp-tRNA(Asn)/Glu-tRNA(Gln) amidotransferase subunit GatC [[Mycoplasma] anseris]|uniref:Glutamyl-tRNA amidotransferase n=1 Tax=[Mycoplasma] anseris TaxID=92400 RepID=A0A2Z4NCS5_9BACT|nr:Asp-tRNA(Asn)/Glu-tRNA(Gln) amidotransferase subunit GatC [[Mycoplasma] anseris]AWX69374.1 glutamyl-tRNA amidotransferase [[Mycoplasma] anseris]